MAIRDYTKAIEVEPEHAGAYVDLGNAYSIKHDFDSAIANYSKAIETEYPMMPTPIVNSATFSFKKVILISYCETITWR